MKKKKGLSKIQRKSIKWRKIQNALTIGFHFDFLDNNFNRLKAIRKTSTSSSFSKILFMIRKLNSIQPKWCRQSFKTFNRLFSIGVKRNMIRIGCIIPMVRVWTNNRSVCRGVWCVVRLSNSSIFSTTKRYNLRSGNEEKEIEREKKMLEMPPLPEKKTREFACLFGSLFTFRSVQHIITVQTHQNGKCDHESISFEIR